MLMKKYLYILLSLAALCGCKDGIVEQGPFAPKLLSVIPKAGYPGSEATISGYYLSGDKVEVSVGGTAAAVESASIDRICIVMPEKALGTYEVTVSVDGRESGGLHFRYAEHPEAEVLKVLSYSPAHGYEGDKVTIYGQLFSPRSEHNSVTINGKDCEILSSSSGKIVVILPDNPEGRYPFVVTVDAQTATGPEFTYDRMPELGISSVTPAMGVAGEEIVLGGTRFSEDILKNIVSINGVRAEVLSASKRELRIKAPDNPAGSYPVIITVGDQTAEGPSFLYLSKKYRYTVKTISGLKGRAADMSTVIDGGPTEVKYWQPRGIVFLPDGRMMIFDNGNNALRYMDLSTYNVTSSSAAKSYLNAAWRGCVHGDWVYIASKGNNRIVRYNYKNDVGEIVSSNFSGTSPMDVCFDSSGNGYVLVRDGSQAIFKAPAGDFSAMEVFCEFEDGPLAMQFAPDGQLIVTTAGCQVLSVTPDGSKRVIAGIRGAKSDDDGTPGNPLSAKFGSNLFGVTVDPEGNIYVADDSNKVIKFILKGSLGYENAVVQTVMGTSGKTGTNDGTGTSACFSTPGEIRMSPDGSKLYVSEYSNFIIREISIETI